MIDSSITITSILIKGSMLKCAFLEHVSFGHSDIDLTRPRWNAWLEKSRQVILEGRMFTRLKVGGLSLVCVFHQNCTKDVTFGKHGQITEEEARRRLLAWEADWINYVENHHLAGGRLLGNYADCSHQFASSSSKPSR